MPCDPLTRRYIVYKTQRQHFWTIKTANTAMLTRHILQSGTADIAMLTRHPRDILCSLGDTPSLSGDEQQTVNKQHLELKQILVHVVPKLQTVAQH